MASLTRKQLAATLNKFYKNPVARVSFEFFLSLIAIIFFTIFAIRPTLLIISDLIKEINDKEALEKQMQKKIAALSTAQEEYQLIQDDLQYLDQAIPSEPNLINSLKVIEKLASNNKVIITSLKTSSVPEEKKIVVTKPDDLTRQDLYITVQAVGDYPSLKDFAASINSYRRAFVLEEISFTIDDKIVQQTLKAAFTIRMPYFGEENATEI